MENLPGRQLLAPTSRRRGERAATVETRGLTSDRGRIRRNSDRTCSASGRSVGRISTPGGRFGPRSHLVSALLALVPLTLAGLQQSARPALYAVAALLGFHACSLVGRWILRAPIGSPFPIAMLAFGAAFQVTLGWLHGAAWAEPLAPMLVFEGLLLTWMAIGAARAVSQVAVSESSVTQAALSKAEPSRVAVSEPDVSVVASTELGAGADVEADAASKPTQAPALQPLPTPAVGH